MKTNDPISKLKNILVMLQFSVIMRYEKLAREFGETSFKPSKKDYFNFIDTCRNATGKWEICDGVTASNATLEDAKQAFKLVPQVDIEECPAFRTEFVGSVWTRKDGSKTFLYLTLPKIDFTRRPIEMDAAHVLYAALTKHRPFSVEEAQLWIEELLHWMPCWEIHFDHGPMLCHMPRCYEGRYAITQISRWFDGKIHLKKANGCEVCLTFDQLPTYAQGMVVKYLMDMDEIQQFAARLKEGYSDEEIADAFESLAKALAIREHKLKRSAISEEEDWVKERRDRMYGMKIKYIQEFVRNHAGGDTPLKIEDGFDSPYMKHLLNSLGKKLRLTSIQKLPNEDGEYCLLLGYKDAEGNEHEYKVWGPYDNYRLLMGLYNFVCDVEDHMPLYYEVIGDTLMSTLE